MHNTRYFALGGLACIAVWGVVTTLFAAEPTDDRPRVTVGIVYDGPAPDQEIVSLSRFLQLPEQIRSEVLGLTRRDFDLRFPEEKRVTGDWVLSSIESAIDGLLADPEVDVVLTLGVFGSTLVCRRNDLPKPVIAPLAVDAMAQSLPLVDNTSGVRNLNYLIRRGNVLQDLSTFRNKLVAFDRLHVVVDSMFIEAIADLEQYVTQLDQQIGSQAVLVPVAHSAQEALDQLDGAEAVYVTPLMRMTAGEFDRLVAGLIERKLPSFSLQGEVEVRRGLLAGLRRATDTSRMARRVALNLQRILLGEDAGTLPVTIEQPERLLINMSTANRIGVHPRWRVTLEADLVHEVWPWGHGTTPGEPLTLSRAVVEAVDANLELRSADRRVAAGADNVALARSRYRPRVEASAQGLVIDEDSASILQPERTASGGLRATQTLYSDATLSGIEVSRQLQRSVESDRETLRLDVALEAAIAFLDVLRSQTLERVGQDNLRLTESNLELARKRVSIGFSGPADVYRWEAELATDRSQVISAHAGVHSAYLVLNRVLHRPLEQLSDTEAPSLEDPQLRAGTGRLNRYIDNQTGFDLFREFSARQGLANAPELQALDALIAAEERSLTAVRRSYWTPELSLFGEAGRDFTRDGTGSSGERDSWNVGLLATLPLFSGGARAAEARQSSEELAGLRIDREALAEGVELRVRSVLFAISASFPSIELAQEAATAARKNLDLVTDSYSSGVVSIIELLDAQNAALVAEEFAANAVYDFLVDLMKLQRATGDFDFFTSDEGREAWFDRLEKFFVAAGYETRR